LEKIQAKNKEQDMKVNRLYLRRLRQLKFNGFKCFERAPAYNLRCLRAVHGKHPERIVLLTSHPSKDIFSRFISYFYKEDIFQNFYYMDFDDSFIK